MSIIDYTHRLELVDSYHDSLNASLKKLGQGWTLSLDKIAFKENVYVTLKLNVSQRYKILTELRDIVECILYLNISRYSFVDIRFS